jgi:predicted dehydrogenase
MSQPRPLRVGVAGFGWMGQVHARAYGRLRHHYPDSPFRPELVAVADPADARRAEAVAGYGFATAYADWRELVARDDLDLVSVTGPNFVHRDIAVAAARAGQHLWVEKPAGRNLAETREIAAAVRGPGYRRRSASTTATPLPWSGPGSSSPPAGWAGSSTSPSGCWPTTPPTRTQG